MYNQIFQFKDILKKEKKKIRINVTEVMVAF